MDAGRALVQARRRALLSQRRLAAATGVSQPTISRIESGSEVPRVDTLDRLLRACGDALEAVPLAGAGVDRTMIRDLLRLSPAERLELSVDDAAALEEFDQSLARARP